VSPNPNQLGKISFGVAAAGAVIAAASFHQRRKVATEVIHPLAGSIAKRVENFEKFAGPHAQNVRPTLDYNAMPDTAVMV
jgi:ATP-dependent protease HslVU (ClpYQ) peptidase subunit